MINVFFLSYGGVTLISDSLGRNLDLPGVKIQPFPGMTLDRCMYQLGRGRLFLDSALVILFVGTNDVRKFFLVGASCTQVNLFLNI